MDSSYDDYLALTPPVKRQRLDPAGSSVKEERPSTTAVKREVKHEPGTTGTADVKREVKPGTGAVKREVKHEPGTTGTAAVQRAGRPARRNQKALIKVRRLRQDDPDRMHFLACDKIGCGRCRWAVCKASWNKEYRMPNSTDTWIGTRTSSTSIRFGCLICKAAKYKSAFANINVPLRELRKTKLLNHSRSKQHVRACQLWQGQDPDNGSIPPDVAPPLAHFAIVLELTRKGKSTGDIPKVGGSEKVRCMKWCLAEAKRGIKRKHLATAMVAGIHQDGRKARLAIRYTCCGSDLHPKAAYLGSCDLAKEFALDAIGTRAGTESIIRKFCTPLLSPPHCKTPPETELDKNVLAHIRKIVELFDADSASDETVAGKLLAGTRKHDDDPNTAPEDQAFLFNIRVQNKDKAHGSRRTLVTCQVMAMAMMTVMPNAITKILAMMGYVSICWRWRSC